MPRACDFFAALSLGPRRLQEVERGPERRTAVHRVDVNNFTTSTKYFVPDVSYLSNGVVRSVRVG
jgi:hypothetical protein